MNAARINDAALRRALLIDAAASGAMGLMVLLGAGLLDQALALPASLLRAVGVGLVPFAGLLVWIARRTPVPLGLARVVVAGNALWVVASVALLLSDAVAPTRLGVLFVLAQAAAVAVFAWLEHAGVRQAAVPPLYPTTLRTDRAASSASSAT